MQQDLIPHLFRKESGKITAVLCRTFGFSHIEVAEDITSETFLTALEIWPYKGVPENPTAWLYAVAKNKAKTKIRRDQTFSEKIADELITRIKNELPTEIDLSEQNITDSQLRMLFALCHPILPVESQIGLSLRILCGFGIEEIANAFLTSKETINKRLFRAKEKLRSERIAIIFPNDVELDQRLDTVLTTLYLLFNEGYYPESENAVLREDLCMEAIRLTHLLVDYERTNKPATSALLALMYFHSSRFSARKNDMGELILYHDQDVSKWNYEYITRGAYYLNVSSQGKNLTNYHLEAGIAYWHTIKDDSKEKWNNILQLYNQLLLQSYSPIAALNRTYALSKANGVEEALVEAEKLQLETNPFYFALLGELYQTIDATKARLNFHKAITLARTTRDKEVLTKKLNSL